MWKIRAHRNCQRCVRSAVIGMTMTTSEIRIPVGHRPMQGRDFAHLHRHVEVTGCTAVCHCQDVPRRDMTNLALPARLRVRSHPAERLPRLRVERTRAVKHASLRKGRARDHQRCDQCSDDSRGSKATETRGSHVPSRLFQKRGVIQRCTNVDERCHEQRHANWNMDGMPERHQPPRLTQSRFRQRTLNLQPIQRARDARVDISSYKPADNDDDREKRGHSRQTVELPRGVEQNHERSNQPGENVKFQPGRHASPARTATAFSQAIE